MAQMQLLLEANRLGLVAVACWSLRVCKVHNENDFLGLAIHDTLLCWSTAYTVQYYRFSLLM